MPGRRRRVRCRFRRLPHLVFDPDAAQHPARRGRHVRHGGRPRARHHARRGRRLRSEEPGLSRGTGGAGAGPPARPPREVGGGSARAFPDDDPGTRPGVGCHHRRGRRCEDPGPQGQPDSRRGRLPALGRHHALYLGLHPAGAVRGAGLQVRGHHRLHQPDADHAPARRRAAAGCVRHGTADGPGGPRAGARPGGGPSAQPDPCRRHALQHGPDLPRWCRGDLRFRRLSQGPGDGVGQGGLP